MQPRISMVTLGVKDLERSTRFYEEGLGLPRMQFEGDAVFFQLNGSWLGLYPWDALAEDATLASGGKGFRGVSLAHNVETRHEVDQLLSQAERVGATIVKPPQDAFWGGYSGYFSDPDGHLWEVAWNPHFWVGPENS